MGKWCADQPDGPRFTAAQVCARGVEIVAAHYLGEFLGSFRDLWNKAIDSLLESEGF